jgi:uncharacterized protein
MCYNSSIVIPIFPDFKDISLEDKKEIEKITNKFQPYSDYNTASLFCFNINDQSKVSLLNNNLVVSISDYITNEPIISFMGFSKVLETIKYLIEYAKSKNINHSIKLIPDEIILSNQYLTEEYFVTEDKNNFDYIISLENLLNFPGSSYATKRRLLNNFVKNYSNALSRELDLGNELVKIDILKIFDFWKMEKNLRDEDISIEHFAIKRLLENANKFNLCATGVYLNGKLIAFAIDEVVSNGFAMGHFMKADKSFKGVYEFLHKETAKNLIDKGCNYLNFEQDMGNPGLRKSKELWNPIRFLKKYTISEKEI